MANEQPPIINRLGEALLLRAFTILDEQRSKAHVFDPNFDVLVHYTDSATGLKILAQDDLWLFDLTTSNDPAEQILGLQQAHRAFGSAWNFTLSGAEALCGVIDDPTTEVDLQRINAIGKRLQRSLLHSARRRAFGLCFATALGQELESLPLWRCYGADGAGIALIFNQADVRHTFLDHAHLVEVLYSETEYSSLCRFLCIAVEELLRSRNHYIRCWTLEISGLRHSPHPNTIYAAGRLASMLLASLRKANHYAYEAEVRLVSIPKGQSIETLAAKGRTARDYVRLRSLTGSVMKKLPIAKIILGPRAKTSTTDKRIQKICRERRIPCMESAISYRGTDFVESGYEEALERVRERDRSISEFARSRDLKDEQHLESLKDKVAGKWDSLENEASERNEYLRRKFENLKSEENAHLLLEQFLTRL